MKPAVVIVTTTLTLGMMSSVFASTPAFAAETTTTPAKGITRIHRTAVNVGGAVQDYHVVLVDMTEPTLRLAVTAQADRNKTTSVLGTKHKAKLAINGSFFSYANHDPCGATRANGTFWTNAYSGCATTIAFGAPPGQPRQVGMFGTGNDTNGPFPASFAFGEEAISGKPWVLKNGAYTGPWTDPDHINTRNPRTAIGYTAGGKKVVILVADGRRTGASGMVGTDIVTVMKEFNATDAMNLDGGGSTTLWTKGGGVVNKPSDGSERPVAAAIVILPDTVPPPSPDAGGADGAASSGAAATPSDPNAPGGAPPNEGDDEASSQPSNPEGSSDQANASDAAGEGCNAAPNSTSDPSTLAAPALVIIALLKRRRSARALGTST